MHDPLIPAMLAVATLAGLVILALAGLRAWHEWVELQRLTLSDRPRDERVAPAPTAARIELADLRERVRKLEAIASGVDL